MRKIFNVNKFKTFNACIICIVYYFIFKSIVKWYYVDWIHFTRMNEALLNPGVILDFISGEIVENLNLPITTGTKST